jgi:hypothetical protein
MNRRYDDQMMLIDRHVVCEELRDIADGLGMSQAELLRSIAAESLPKLRARLAATRREARRAQARAASRAQLDAMADIAEAIADASSSDVRA